MTSCAVSYNDNWNTNNTCSIPSNSNSAIFAILLSSQSSSGTGLQQSKPTIDVSSTSQNVEITCLGTANFFVTFTSTTNPTIYIINATEQSFCDVSPPTITVQILNNTSSTIQPGFYCSDKKSSCNLNCEVVEQGFNKSLDCSCSGIRDSNFNDYTSIAANSSSTVQFTWTNGVAYTFELSQ